MFHLAIPSHDLTLGIYYYVGLGAILGREYDTSAILKWRDLQLVLHKTEEPDMQRGLYPRHFGFVLHRTDFARAYLDFKDHISLELFTRYRGKPGEHQTFFLKDPSNNLIEFKTYKDQGDV